MTIDYRPASARDHKFIIGSWEASYRLANTSGMILMSDWAAIMRDQIAKVLDRPYVSTIVAHETNDPDPVADLYGFITAEPDESPPLVYYVYVKDNFRKFGIARGLFGAMGIDPLLPFAYVCSTPIVPKVARKIPCARWQPIMGRYSREKRKHR